MFFASLLFQTLTVAAQVLPYHGGLVVSNVEVTTIFYGAARFQPQINQYYAALTNSPYIDWLSEYNTPTQKIGRGRLVGSFSETSNIKTHLVDNTDLHQYFVNLIKTGKIAPNANSYYALHFQQGISVDYVWYTNGQPSTCTTCSGCGAWHTVIVLADYGISIPGVPYLYYGVLPDCGGSTFDHVSISHELIETITDPAGDIAALAAWDDTNDTSGGEVADKCEFGTNSGTVVGGDGVSYTVATGWSDILGKCIVSNPSIPPQTTTVGGSTTTVRKTTIFTTTTTTTVAAVKTSTTKQVVPTTTTNVPVVTTTKKSTTTKNSAGTAVGQGCTNYGSWACSYSLLCSYGNSGSLVWVQVGSVSSC
ncbi:hypothetical protein BCR33DRAFT_740898 [Rhizoclosmatium globosum]|uniref:CBM1 domain-containing protein n=1 Tax=Rhizoclosmatium globosum TaxID=329046 RepID=A0A1Y2BXT3_9FUNG|nr:hypothetical protein BCR33DRAFT_740898 [Rhizoclosmatium globosum]|eukprot:ORY39579.1 hypothetical protein BCR33DRAFT_740898 [Rhizoclosmatium globosum]